MSLCVSTTLIRRGCEQSAYLHRDYLFLTLLVSQAHHDCSFEQVHYQCHPYVVLAFWADLGIIPETIDSPPSPLLEKFVKSSCMND